MATAVISKPKFNVAANLATRYQTSKNSPGMDFDDALEQFIRSRKLGMFGAKVVAREKSIENYRYDLGIFVNYMKGKKHFKTYNQMTGKDVADFIEFYSDKKLKQNSKSKVFRGLRAFFNWVRLCPDCKELGMKPWLDVIPTIPVNTKRLWVPTPDEMNAFVSGFDQQIRWGLRDFVVASLMMDCGARIGEVCNMELDSIKWDISHVVLNGKSKHERIVPVDRDLTLPLLKRWIRERERFAKCDALFLNRFGGRCTSNTFDQSFSDNRIKVFGLRKGSGEVITPHTFRHYFCTYYLVNGGKLENLQSITGHTSLNTLMIYVHMASQINHVAAEHEKVSPLKNLSANMRGPTKTKKRKVC